MVRAIERSLKASLALLLAAAMALPLTGGGASQAAYADEPVAADRAAAQADDDGPLLEIRAGAATPVSPGSNTYHFPNLTVISRSEKKVCSITVQFTTAIGASDDVTFTTADGFELYQGNKRGNRSVNSVDKSGATAEEWQNYLREHMTVTLDGSGVKGLRMIASFEQVDRTLDFNSENGHYYEYVHVPGASATVTTIAWTEAFERASEATYMDMTGYLVTVTSAKEQQFISSLINSRTWIGATCWPEYTGDSSSHPKRAGSATVKYYWACGPEKGINFATGSVSSGTLNSNASSRGYYANFTGTQPDNASNVGLWLPGGADLGEYMVHMYEDGRWNDYPNWPTNPSHYVQGYIIEYGDNPLDDDDDDNAGGGGADVDVNVDVYVKVDINVDPSGKTITTEAYDVTVGEPVRVLENVNGDTSIKTTVTKADGTTDTKDAQVERVYKVKDPEAQDADENGWRPLRDDEKNASGEPFRPGTYQVTSTAPFTEGADGTATEMYAAGTATFVIKPKVLDVAKPASTPDDPAAPDASEDVEYTDPDTGEKIVASGRGWSKVYDGSPYLAGGNVSLADGLLAGASAWLTFERAEFSDADAGSRDLTLYGVKVAGPDAGDYRLAGLASDGTLKVKGAIVPRDLVISTRWFKAAGADPSTWVRDVPFADPSGAAVGCYSDAAAFDASAATGSASDGTNTWPVAWPTFMLAPGDTLDAVLGEASFTASTAGGLALNVAAPQLGTYSLGVGFARVTAGEDGSLVTADGNYRVTVLPASLEVTERRVVDLTKDDPIDIVRPVEPSKPAPAPVTKDDLAQIVEDKFGPDAPAPSGGKIPEGVEPVVTIKKGGVPVDAIDPSVPGEYEITVTYPAPDGTDYVAEIDYVVERDPLPSPGAGLFTVATRLAGATQGAAITPTRTLKAGASGDVAWTAGPDCYVASVEVDGKVVTLDEARWTFQNLSANHEVVVTLARNPIMAGSSTGGFYTITVNRYGTGAEASPSAVLSAGEDGRATWSAAAGYRIAAVWVDGVQLSEQAVAAGSVDFAKVSANHVVDVYTERADGTPSLRADDLLVTTQIKGGPGTITGSATVTAGGAYHVEWQPVVQTTSNVDDPSYAVYEVAKVEVNGAEAAGTDERALDLSNIKENKDVVVTLRPVVYDVSVLAYGPGTASASRTLFKGQGYVDISGVPAGSARISYIEVDGLAVYDERVPAGALASVTGFSDMAGAVRSAVGQALSGAPAEDSADVASSLARTFGLAAETAYADEASRAAEPVFPVPAIDRRQADGSRLDMGITGINADHVVKVYFAAEDEGPVNPDTVTDKVDVTAGVEGGPGSVSVGDGTGFVDPDENQTVTWEIPEGYVPTEIVVGGTRIPIEPGADKVVIPGGTLKPGDHVSLVVEKRVPGDETVPSRSPRAEAAEQLRVDTSLTGGVGTITGGASVDRHGSYTVEWSAGEGYRVAKVIIDGVERPDLLGASSFTFEDIGENHTIQIVLEPIDGDGTGVGDGADGAGGSDDGSGSGDGDGAGGWKTLGTRLAQTGDELIGVAGAALLLALSAGFVLAAVRRRSRE